MDRVYPSRDGNSQPPRVGPIRPARPPAYLASAWLALSALLIAIGPVWTAGAGSALWTGHPPPVPAVRPVNSAPVRSPGRRVLAEVFEPSPAPAASGNAATLTDEAYRHLSRLEFQEAAAKALQAIEIAPNDARARAVRGIALVFLDHLDPGEQEIRRAERADEKLALAAVGHGTLAWKRAVLNENSSERRKLLEEAEAQFQRAIKLDTNEVSAHNGLGTIYCLQERYDKAEKSLLTAIRRNPEYTAAHATLGNVYLQKQQWEQAEAAYRQAIQRDERSAGFRAGLAAALLGQKKRAEAQEVADAARSRGLAPDHWLFKELARAR